MMNLILVEGKPNQPCSGCIFEHDGEGCANAPACGPSSIFKVVIDSHPEYEVWRYAINKIEQDGSVKPMLLVLTEEEANKYAGREDITVEIVYMRRCNK